MPSLPTRTSHTSPTRSVSIDPLHTLFTRRHLSLPTRESLSDPGPSQWRRIFTQHDGRKPPDSSAPAATTPPGYRFEGLLDSPGSILPPIFMVTPPPSPSPSPSSISPNPSVDISDPSDPSYPSIVGDSSVNSPTPQGILRPQHNRAPPPSPNPSSSSTPSTPSTLPSHTTSESDLVWFLAQLEITRRPDADATTSEGDLWPWRDTNTEFESDPNYPDPLRTSTPVLALAGVSPYLGGPLSSIPSSPGRYEPPSTPMFDDFHFPDVPSDDWIHADMLDWDEEEGHGEEGEAMLVQAVKEQAVEYDADVSSLSDAVRRPKRALDEDEPDDETIPVKSELDDQNTHVKEEPSTSTVDSGLSTPCTLMSRLRFSSPDTKSDRDDKYDKGSQDAVKVDAKDNKDDIQRLLIPSKFGTSLSTDTNISTTFPFLQDSQRSPKRFRSD